jgi:hypothetical protein
MDINRVGLRKYHDYCQYFPTYVKKEAIRQKPVGFYQKLKGILF